MLGQESWEGFLRARKGLPLDFELCLTSQSPLFPVDHTLPALPNHKKWGPKTGEVRATYPCPEAYVCLYMGIVVGGAVTVSRMYCHFSEISPQLPHFILGRGKKSISKEVGSVGQMLREG